MGEECLRDQMMVYNQTCVMWNAVQLWSGQWSNKQECVLQSCFSLPLRNKWNCVCNKILRLWNKAIADEEWWGVWACRQYTIIYFPFPPNTQSKHLRPYEKAEMRHKRNRNLVDREACADFCSAWLWWMQLCQVSLISSQNHLLMFSFCSLLPNCLILNYVSIWRVRQ